MCAILSNMKTKRKDKIVGLICIVFGVLWAVNALVAGPNAFGAKWLAVALLCSSGLGLAAAGVFVLKSGTDNSISKQK